ncbi:uncharacterized protein LOC131018951 [Salvia miltiorrhiza]|uniref:uncharacterized protein LOC131018951 n=1 Tax=Salvia miltiorrhiza TaxID=226208 RepID=UPI0025AC3CD3|nr:uncharacterized protein LOC131018951 [Salvia miltiorrhiza]
MNEAFLMKITWNVIKGHKFGYDLMQSRYLDGFDRPCDTLLASSVWGRIKQLVPELIADSYCLLGRGFSVLFWDDDWLGYFIADKISIPSFMRHRLKQTVADYFYDGYWHFAMEFVEKFLNTVCDILLMPIGHDDDIRFWKPSVHGEVTSALAFASRCHHFPMVAWGRWI